MMSGRALAFSFTAFLCVSSAEGTELHLRFKDEQGRNVQLSKAEMLVVGWGIAERLELEIAGEHLVVPLDESWLRSRWSTRFMDVERAYLFLQADGYAAVRSQPFLWIGAHGPPYGPRVTEAKIAFRGGEKVVVQAGETAELKLVLRRPKERYLRIIDDDGKPVQEVRVTSYMFWSDSNRCGHLAGADSLGKGMSDVHGRVPIPDGDFEYVFELEKRLYVLKNPKGFPFHPPRLIAYLNAEETVVQLHQWHRRPLEMRVVKNGRPVVGQVLLGRVAGCPCGACSGPLGETDQRGMIRIPDFYPEEWEYVFFADDKEKPIWQADPTKWPRTGTIEAELGADNVPLRPRPASR